MSGAIAFGVTAALLTCFALLLVWLVAYENRDNFENWRNFFK